MVDPGLGGCFFCDKPSVRKCPHCHLVRVCSDWHQTLHRPDEYCQPVRIARHPEAGLYMVATRDISPLEVAVNQFPVVWGPYSRPHRPVCLQCLKVLEVSSPDAHRCTKCGYPMCSRACEDGDTHGRLECAVFQRSGFRLPRLTSNEEYDERCKEFSPYCFIMTLRCLLLKEMDPKVWEDLEELRDHNEERRLRDPEGWQEHEVKVQRFLREELGLASTTTPEEIYRVIGVLSTNNANLALGEGFGKGAGLYLTYSRVNHSCSGNTKTLKYKDNRLELRASKVIKAGQEVSNQYVKPDIGTVSRRLILRNKWHFDCCCSRCSDPTEFGTFMSAVICQCCGGTVLPNLPLVFEGLWQCRQCAREVAPDQVASAIMEAEEALKKGHQDDEDIVQRLERFVCEQSRVLHENNYILLGAKMKLALLYGNIRPYLLEQMGRPCLERKRQVCEQVLDVLGRVDAGYSSWRSSVLSELTRTNVLIAKMDFKAGRLGKDQLVNVLSSEKMLKCYLGYHNRLFFGAR